MIITVYGIMQKTTNVPFKGAHKSIAYNKNKKIISITVISIRNRLR